MTAADYDAIEPRTAERRITAPTPQWRLAHPWIVVELILTWCAVGWVVIGLISGLADTPSPAGNAFGVAASFVGSWHVLVGILALDAVLLLVGMAADNVILRRLGLGLSAFNWGFIAAGLSTTGFVSTAVVVYPMLCTLSVAAWLAIPRR